MTLEILKQAANRIVGVKQSEKAVQKGTAEVVFIAADADKRVVQGLAQLCETCSVPVVTTECMADIGKACGINVRAAAAAVLKVDKGLA